MTAHDTICSVYGLTPTSASKPSQHEVCDVLLADMTIVTACFNDGILSQGSFAIEDGYFHYQDAIGWRPARRAAV